MMYNKFEIARILGTCKSTEDVFTTTRALFYVFRSGNYPNNMIEPVREMSKFRIETIIRSEANGKK